MFIFDIFFYGVMLDRSNGIIFANLLYQQEYTAKVVWVFFFLLHEYKNYQVTWNTCSYSIIGIHCIKPHKWNKWNCRNWNTNTKCLSHVMKNSNHQNDKKCVLLSNFMIFPCADYVCYAFHTVQPLVIY